MTILLQYGGHLYSVNPLIAATAVAVPSYLAGYFLRGTEIRKHAHPSE